MNKQQAENLKIKLLKDIKEFYTEEGLSKEEMKHLAKLVIFDIAFEEDEYDYDLFQQGR